MSFLFHLWQLWVPLGNEMIDLKGFILGVINSSNITGAFCATCHFVEWYHGPTNAICGKIGIKWDTFSQWFWKKLKKLQPKTMTSCFGSVCSGCINPFSKKNIWHSKWALTCWLNSLYSTGAQRELYHCSELCFKAWTARKHTVREQYHTTERSQVQPLHLPSVLLVQHYVI